MQVSTTIQRNSEVTDLWTQKPKRALSITVS